MMLFPIKSKSTLIAFCLLMIMSFQPVLLHSQNDSYMGVVSNITEDELITKATSAEFGTNISTIIHKDEKNSYYAVDVTKLPSKFEKIRTLELIFDDKNIVNISSDINSNYYLFLVNNMLNKTSDEIIESFEDFRNQAKTELEALNDEQLRLWYIQHDKYSTKQ